MLEYGFFWTNLVLTTSLLVVVYIYCFKVYGVKTTLIINACTSSFVLIIIFTGFYSAAELHLPSYFTGRIGETEFHLTDPIGIFITFIICFELGRISLRKIKGNPLTYKQIIYISILVSFYGMCLQPITDLTASAVGYYYYENPPEINIFGYPVWFFLSFSIYGFYALIFLLFEKKYSFNSNSIKKKNEIK